MNKKIHSSMQDIVDKTLQFMEQDDPTALDVLSGEELVVGPTVDVATGRPNREFMTPAHALDQPVYVGDAAAVSEEPVANEEVRALMKSDPSKVIKFPRWNRERGRYDIHYRKAGSVSDAAPDLIGAQLLAAPGLVGYFEQLFRKPLLYFKARNLVKIQSGSSPWASIMTLYTANYAGGAVLAGAGSPENNANADVNAQAGLMTSPVINARVSYSLSVEELERAKGGQMPFGGQLIDQKREYADYSLELLTNALIIYGNAPSETQGLLDVGNGPIIYQKDSMEHISLNGSETAKGSKIYQALGREIADFLTASMNKFNKVRIAVSPGLYNLLSYIPYSDVYDPTAALKITLANFMAGEMKDGRVPDLEIYPEPLCAQSHPGGFQNPFNPTGFDIMIITAPEITAGPDEVAQPVVLFGAPLMRFVYPTIPGQYMTNYQILRRMAGVFAPVIKGVKVIVGFGFQEADT